MEMTQIKIEKSTKRDAFEAGRLARELWGERSFPGSFYRQAIDSFGESVLVAKTSQDGASQ